jgi:peroxiredoxin Q/BCP
MPPRKPATTDLGADEPAPRRSGRIASQPKLAEEAPAKATASKSAKKRTAEAVNEDGNETKKVRRSIDYTTLYSYVLIDVIQVKADENETAAGTAEENAADIAEQTTTEDVAPGDEPNPPTAKLPPVEVGEKLPSFVLKNEKDEDVDVSTLTGEKGLVLFLVPKADTRASLQVTHYSVSKLTSAM